MMRSPFSFCKDTHVLKEHECSMRDTIEEVLRNSEYGRECYRRQGNRPAQNTEVAAAARGHFWRGTVGQPISLVVLWSHSDAMACSREHALRVRDNVQGGTMPDSFMDKLKRAAGNVADGAKDLAASTKLCLLYTSDAADEEDSVD